MDEITQLSSADLEMSISNQDIRISQVIAGAMFIGVFAFCAIVFFMYSKTDPSLIPEEVTDGSPVPLFSLILIGLTIIMYFLAFNLLRIIHSPEKLKSILSGPMNGPNGPITDTVQKLIALNRIRMIIRLAMLEGVALFGVVALFIAVQDGTIYTDQKYWGLLIPAGLFFLYIYANFPFKQRVIDQIENELIKPIRSV